MSISILILTKNRRRFSNLVAYNINTQTYTDIKEVIVLDDGLYPLDLSLCIYNVKYITKNENMSIGQKRNYLIKECKTKYFCFMDDDDFYMPEYIEHSMSVLLSNKKYKIVGSTEMNFYFELIKGYGAMSCSTIWLPHEATMVGETKFLKTHKFKNTNSGEGNFLQDLTSFLGLTDIDKCMVCLCHGANTISKDKWYMPLKNQYYCEKFSKKIENHIKLI